MSDVKYIVVYDTTVSVFDEYANDGTRYQTTEQGYRIVDSLDAVRHIIEDQSIKNKRFFEIAKEVFPKLEVKVTV